MTTAYKFPWDACKAEWPEQKAAIDQLVAAVCAAPGTRYDADELYKIMGCDVFDAYVEIVGSFIDYGFIRQLVVSTVDNKEYNSISEVDELVNTLATIKVCYEVL